MPFLALTIQNWGTLITPLHLQRNQNRIKQNQEI